MSKSSGDSASERLDDAVVIWLANGRPEATRWAHAIAPLASEVLEHRTLDAKRRCDNCVHYDRPTDADPWPSCMKLAVGVDPGWFCADWGIEARQ